jgi:hypothetical protein
MSANFAKNTNVIAHYLELRMAQLTTVVVYSDKRMCLLRPCILVVDYCSDYERRIPYYCSGTEMVRYCTTYCMYKELSANVPTSVYPPS